MRHKNKSVGIRRAMQAGLLSLTALLPLTARAQMEEFGRTDAQKEIEMGRQYAREYEKMNPLSRDKAMQARVQRIGSELVAALPQKMYPYEFKVIGSSEVNACCIPGGFIYVNEGLAARLPDDNALAFVLGHEITHGAHRHQMRQLQKMKGVSILAAVGSVLTRNADTMSMMRNLMGLKYSRDDENDADKTGMETMWRAGFDPKGAVEAMELLVKVEGKSRTPTYLLSHPHSAERLKRLTAQIEPLKSQPRAAASAATTAPTAGEADLTPIIGTLPEQEITPNPWFPLAVGNAWTYTVSGGGGQSAYTLRVAAAIAAKTGMVFRAETILGRGTPVACQFFTTATEVYRRNRPALSQSAWNVEYVVPLADEQPQERAGTVFSLLPPEPMTLPCGVFTDIIHIRKRTGQNNYDLWFARDVGLIKRSCAETGVTEILEAYKVQAPKPFDAVQPTPTEP